MTNVKSLLALYLKMGGSLTDTYSDIAGGIPVGQYSLISDAVLACSKKYSSSGGGLPADFPAEGIANANKFLGFDNSGDYAALDAPSGAEKFVVTLTEDDSGEETVWTADKTVAEIVAADAADQIVVCKVSPSGGGMPYELPITTAVEVAEEAYISIFTGVIMSASGNGNDSATVFGSFGDGQTNWVVTTTPIPTSSNAPLIVTMTEDQQNPGTYVGDKTFGEVYTAVSAGKTVYIYAMGGYAILNVCSLESGTYTIVGAAEGMTFAGTENDYLTVRGS